MVPSAVGTNCKEVAARFGWHGSSLSSARRRRRSVVKRGAVAAKQGENAHVSMGQSKTTSRPQVLGSVYQRVTGSLQSPSGVHLFGMQGKIGSRVDVHGQMDLVQG